MMDRATILLTGATGFIGSHLLKQLIRQNYKVIVLKKSTSDMYRIKDYTESKILTFYDIDKVDLEFVFQKNSITHIFHLATKYIKSHNSLDIDDLVDSNIKFPLKLLDFAVQYGVRNFVNTGTFFEYDSFNRPINENNNIRPLNLYAQTKITFEDILKNYTDANLIQGITLKLFTPYGSYDNDNKIIPYIIKKIVNKEKIVLNDRFVQLDFIYIDDIIKAYMNCFLYLHCFYKVYDSFNICSGKSYSIIEVIGIIEHLVDYRADISYDIKSEKSNIVIGDPSKAIARLDWSPKTSISEGLEKTIRYYVKESK